MYGQSYKLPYNLSVDAYDIYSEQGKIKAYIIDVDDQHLSYVSKKSEAQYALVSDCAACKSLPIDQIIKIERKYSSKPWLIGLGVTTIVGGVLAGTGSPEENRGRWSLGLSISYYGGIICLTGAVISSFRKSPKYSARYRGISLAYLQEEIERNSLQDFKENKIGKRKAYIFHINNYTASVTGYVVASNETFITVVGNKYLFDNPGEVTEENSLHLFYDKIDFIKRR